MANNNQKSKKGKVIAAIVAVFLIAVCGAAVYFMPTIKFMLRGGTEITPETVDSDTKNYMDIIASMNAQTGQPSDDSSSTDSNSQQKPQNNNSSSENSSSAADNHSSQPPKSDNSTASESANNNNNNNNSDNGNSSDNENIPDNNNDNNNNNNNNNNPDSNAPEPPAETEPQRDYSQFIGTWKGYFGTEMSPTYELFNDLGFELISTDGSDITYTFWLTCNGYSKKLDNTYGRIDDNGRLNIVIDGQDAGLTLDLVFEEDGSLWGVVSNAHILNNPVTFPVLFFQK